MDLFSDDDDDLILLEAVENIENSAIKTNSFVKDARQTTLLEAFGRSTVSQSCSKDLQYPADKTEIVFNSKHEMDLHAFKTWIYPCNVPIRDYQYNIVQKALFTNTLVSLPTGLGKTFIAAVVMYNFYRWFPNGKIIFMAPTKPLVNQQIDACFKITGLPQTVTQELNGATPAERRASSWNSKRVVFLLITHSLTGLFFNASSASK